MGLVKKIITYAIIMAVGASMGSCAQKYNIERKYELVPKGTLEVRVEQEVERIKKIGQDYLVNINDYVK